MTETSSPENESMAAAELHVVFGCNGPLGLELLEQLAARGDVRLRGVCRSGQAAAPPAVEIVAGDASDPDTAGELMAGASVVYSCIGIDYRLWRDEWPAIVDGLLKGAESAGTRLVFADNLYAYGPQSIPLSEGLPLTRYGRKPELRARLVHQLLEAHRAGRVEVVMVRASDFYGPRVRNAMLGERVFRPALAGKAAKLWGDVDQPHAYTYLPDFARALRIVAAHPDAFGQAWHVPNAPARTTREIVEEVFRLAGTTPRLQVLPGWMLPVLGFFKPIFHELRELQYQWTRPFLVDHGKYEERFGDTFTPLEEGLLATVAWWQKEGRRR